MNKRIASKYTDSPTIKMHKASLMITVDSMTREIDIDKDRYGDCSYNVNLPEVLRRLSGHVDDAQKELLLDFADRLENIKAFM